MANVINENILKGKWNEVKGEVQKLWGRLSEDELEKTKGDAKALIGAIQRKYGIKEEEFRAKINDILSKFASSDEKKSSH
jgi:uncharacterized protein YjbJ (UPF0337 family)